jgi:hypothetical protein
LTVAKSFMSTRKIPTRMTSSSERPAASRMARMFSSARVQRASQSCHSEPRFARDESPEVGFAFC